MNDGGLVIEITAREHLVPLPSFLKVVSNSLKILYDLNIGISEGHESIAWRITDASLHSPLTLSIAGEAKENPQIVADIIGAYVEGMNKIEETSSMPPYFSEPILERARAMMSVLNDGVSRLAFRSRYGVAAPTQRVAANIDVLMRGYEDMASFEGRLEMISIHGEPQFRVYDPLTDEPILCFFSPEDIELAKNVFGKRIVVSGTAKYRKDGKCRFLRVEEMTALRDRADLPQFDDVNLNPIDITGGMDAAKYIRRMRDEE